MSASARICRPASRAPRCRISPAIPELEAALRDRGMTAAEVEKVCSGNWLRVFRAVRG